MKDQFTPDGIRLDNALAFWVHRVYQAQRNAMYREFRAVGVELTPEQWVVLVRLWERDGQTQSELSDSTFRDRPTMSRMIDALEKSGLVERRASPSDGRTRHVVLTPTGQGLKTKLVPVVKALVASMTRGIPLRELQTTRSTLARLFENLE